MKGVRRVLEEWNPWWETGKVPKDLKGFPRRVTRELLELMQDSSSAKAIIGPRRAGKTTVMYQIIDELIRKGISPEEVLYVNLEDPRLDNFSLNDIYKEFLAMKKAKEAFIFLDEVHERRNWERWVRTRIDLKLNENIVVSGSTSHLISKKVAHSLAGRVFTRQVYPFSFSEILEINGVKPRGEKGKALANGILEDCLKWGCYPAVVLEKEQNLKMNKLLSYFETVISRDIASSHGLDARKAEDIFKYILKSSGDLTSVNKIRKVFRLSYETAEKYINAMKDSMVILESRRYAFSIKEQMAFPRKLYPIDLGLRRIGTPQTHKDTGKLLETFVAQEMVKAGYEIYYLSNKGECDIIVTERGTPEYALQVTAELSGKNREREVRGLEIAKRELGIDGEILTGDAIVEFLYLLGNQEKVFKSP